MDLRTQLQIRNNPYLYRFLRENSGWYKALNRRPESIREMEKAMKEYYKLTTKDKIDQISRRMEMIQTFMEVLR